MASSNTSPLIDFAIITAIEVERKAVCAALGLSDRSRQRKGARLYWVGRLKLKDGSFYEIVVGQPLDMANIDAALLTEAMIRDWEPPALLMVGIAGAASDDVALGDVVLGSDIYYYERGKVTPKGKKPEPRMYPADASLWDSVIKTTKWTTSIRAPRPDNKQTRPKIHRGVIASGEKVIAEKAVRNQIASVSRKILAIEMEGYGVSSAAWQSPSRPRVLVIRAISDRADRSKKYDWQPYAAAAAAGFTKHFLRDQPLPSRNNFKAGEEKRVEIPVRGSASPTTHVKRLATKDPAAPTAFEWDVFISYSSEDREFADRIKTAVRQKGLRVWIDKEQIVAGDLFVGNIEEGLEKSASIAILISPDSIESGWVRQESLRAISLSVRTKGEVSVIPVLVGKATVPGLLANRSWVDFQDGSQFDAKIRELINGITRPNRTVFSQKDKVEKALLSSVSFLWFFPEGLLPGLYSFLISKLGFASEAEEAERQGLVRVIAAEGLELKGVDPERIRLLKPLVKDAAKLAGELLALVQEWIAEAYPFAAVVELGMRRALLIRDLMNLAKYLPGDDDVEGPRRTEIVNLVREFLPLVVAEGYLPIGLAIGGTLIALGETLTPREHLTHASLLLKIGEAGQAADMFEAYLWPDIFDSIGLSPHERLGFALEWAKASKDASRARSLHSEIVRVYGQMLDLLEVMRKEPAADGELEGWQADILNNRATQLAQFGQESDWPSAQKDFEKAADLYRSQNEPERLVGTVSNFVAQSIDRWDRVRTSVVDLAKLLSTLEDLDNVANQTSAENLFFFLYQRGRLLKRLYPDEPLRAVEFYRSAAEAAREAGLTHRYPIAQRWVYQLRRRGNDISEDDYLQGLEDCRRLLKQRAEDSWAAGSLFSALLDIAQVLRNRKRITDAWATALEAFELAERRFQLTKSNTTTSRLRDILKIMNGLTVNDDTRQQFLQNRTKILRELTGASGFGSLKWSQIANWLKQ
jgi:nucleoside phosphorylase